MTQAGGRNISNARYADDTALIAQSPMEMQQLLDKVNAAGAQRLLKLNVKKTKLMTIGDMPDDINIRVNNDPVEKVKQFKYLGSLKSTDGDCSKDVNARIAMAKRRMCELTTLWKDRSIPVALKMRLVKTLVWTVLSYGAEAWTLKVRDERKITSMEMWLWRKMLRIKALPHQGCVLTATARRPRKMQNAMVRAVGSPTAPWALRGIAIGRREDA